MKIVHICMIAYIDGWGYQDNLLPEYMANAGHDVVVITNNNKFPSYLHIDEAYSYGLANYERVEIQDNEDLERITREIKYLKILKHPNIIQIFQIMEDKKTKTGIRNAVK